MPTIEASDLLSSSLMLTYYLPPGGHPARLNPATPRSVPHQLHICFGNARADLPPGQVGLTVDDVELVLGVDGQQRCQVFDPGFRSEVSRHGLPPASITDGRIFRQG